VPTITVTLNGQLLASVATDEYDVVSVHVHGARTNGEFASVHLSGGLHPQGHESTYLTWINSVLLKSEDSLEVRFSEFGQTSHPGKTIKELFPEEQEESQHKDFRPTPEMFAELRAKPQLRDGYDFSLTLPSGPLYKGRTNEAEHGFGFSVAWNSYRPLRASVSLYSYMIDSMEHQQPMRDHVRDNITLVGAVRFQIAA
jgi:hypothetical protein